MKSNLDRLIQVFNSRGYPPSSGISRLQFSGVLDQLLVSDLVMQGAQFDREVAGELWEQADIDAAGNAEVQQLCEIIEDAQNILVQKRMELNGNCRSHSGTLQHLYARQKQLAQTSGVQQRSGELQLLNAQILQLERDLREYSEDLYLVSFPFGIDLGALPLNNSQMPAPGLNPDVAAGMMASNLMRNSQPLTPVHGLGASGIGMMGSAALTPNPNMSLLFWLVVAFGILELVVMFQKYDFLNLLVFVCIISIFLLNYYDRNYIVLCIALTGVSVLMDVIWLVLLGPKYWSPPAVSEFSVGNWGYMRIIFLFTILQIIVKAGIILLLLRQRNLPENTGFVIDMPRLTIFGNQRNLISQQVGLMTGNRF